MNEQQMTEFAMDTTKNIAALWESTKSAHKRLDENDKVTKGIHQLSASIAGMTAEMKGIAERMDDSNDRMTASVEKISEGQQEQAQRIGAMEKTLITLSGLSEGMGKLGAKIEAIEKEPATKWKDLVKQITALVVAAIIGVIIANFL
jgi:methyl-accepting chemotaxis protein